MSTRSYICIQDKDNKLRGIYCHYDGYISYNGALLHYYYDTKEKVEELLALGDISSLGPRVKPEGNEVHSFERPLKDVTVAYHRDRKETLCPAREVTIANLNSYDSWIEYIYIFTKDGLWHYIKCTGKDDYVERNLYEDLVDMMIDPEYL